jgi:ornithine cyclodeaminase
MQQSILFLSDKQINSLVGGMEDIMHDVERALSLLDSGDAMATNKAVMKWGSTPEDENKYGRINAMPSFVGGEYNMAGIKWIGSGPMNYKKGLPRASVIVILNDPDTKLPVAISDGTNISAMRTGAKGGLAIKYLARKDAKIMTIMGAGAQGRTQLEAALIARPNLELIYIYDITYDRSVAFAKEMSKKYSIKVIPVEEQEEACRQSDIIVTVTLANEPIVEADWIKKGCLMMNIADFEFTYDCVRLAEKIVVDTWENIKHRKISTVSLMYHDGLITDDDITAHLGEIINGKKSSRDNDAQIIYFNAVGMGIEDVAIVTRGYKKALKLGIGTKLAYWE